MKFLKVLSLIKCKVFFCCKSKCSLNDTNGDGIVDTISIVDA